MAQARRAAECDGCVGAGQPQTQRSSTDEETRQRSSIEEEKGSNSSSSSMQSCRTHRSSNSNDAVKGKAATKLKIQKAHSEELRRTSLEGVTTRALSASPKQASEAVAGPLRVLVAEDNLVNQKVLQKVLQRVTPDSPIFIANNGQEALEELEQRVYDIILMDVHMPVIDGLEASRRIRDTYPPEQRPKIVALSADTTQAVHEQGREAGIADFVCKPFRIEELQRVLNSTQRVKRTIPKQ